MNRKTLKWIRVFALLLGIIGIVLTLYLYDWKLLLIIFIFLWANNMSQYKGY